MPLYNLLTENLISARYEKGEKSKLSLPGVLAKLSREDIESFTALQPHQDQSWYCFLVQLAAMAMHESEAQSIEGDENEWTARLRSLTKDFPNDEPWCMVVEDLAKPAFMQTPVSEGDWSAFKKEIIHIPDEIEILNTAKNHDVKSEKNFKPSIENWVFTIISLQTMIGYFGSGNYGIARMRHVYASRPFVSLASKDNWRIQFTRDLKILMNNRNKILNDGRQGKGLLWLYSWDGKSQLFQNDLDPFFIDCARRLRLTINGEKLNCLLANTELARIMSVKPGSAKKTQLITGDPWAPIDIAGETVFAVPDRGYSYKTVHEILFGNIYRKPLSLEFLKEDTGDMLFIGKGLGRSQGNTEGLHERQILIPGKMRFMFDTEENKQKLSKVSKVMIDDVATFTKSVFRYAIYGLLLPDNDKPDYKREEANNKWEKWRKRFDNEIDRIFFEKLWEYSDKDETDIRQLWLSCLKEQGQSILKIAFNSIPLPSVRKYKTISAAEGRFIGSFFNSFPFMKPQPTGGVHA
jgi:hypothetical protein